MTAAGMTRALESEPATFAALRGLALLGGVAALLLVPLAPEHELHLAPLLIGFVVYKAALLLVLLRWPQRSRTLFLATIASDQALVFMLVWFTGGAASHFYLLFYLLVALNAHYFGAGIGTICAVLASALLAAASLLGSSPIAWAHIGARSLVLALLALALGHVATRERQARAQAGRLGEQIRETEVRLVEAEQLANVGRLSAKMAHEIRNPLGAINLNLDMLAEIVRQCQGPDMEEARELTRAIREEIRALANLTDEYLLTARLRLPRLEKEALNDLISELVDFLRPVFEEARIRVTIELEEPLPLMLIDRAMVRQAVHNLLRNSIEMLAPGGRVRVRTWLEAGAAVISVTDDGPGVRAEVATRLFDPFFTTKPRGTGLGLSIAQQVAREHGGTIVWENQPGRGVEFRLVLPMERARE